MTTPTKAASEWDWRRMIAVASVLVIIALAIAFFWYRAAKKVPVCNGLSWWPKKALGADAVKAGKEVIKYYSDNPGATEAAFTLPAYEYWRATTKGDYFTWIYSQCVVEYFTAGEVEFPEDWPPCVFEVEGDCPTCIELRTIRDDLAAAIAEKPEIGTPK